MSKAEATKFIMKCQNWAEIALPIVRKQRPPKIVLKDGTHIEARGIQWYDVDDIFFKHMYNPNAQLQIGKDDIVVDIGANIGLFSLYAARITQNTVYAFEPTPDNAEIIRRNIRANVLNNIVLYDAAISDKVGTAKLFLHPHGSSGNVVFDHSSITRLERVHKIEDHIEVSTTTLPNVMDSNNIEELGFLKLDCEGSEGIILETLPKSYLRRIRKIAMEYHDRLSKLNHHEIRKLLEESGFTTDVIEVFPVRGYLYAWQA